MKLAREFRSLEELDLSGTYRYHLAKLSPDEVIRVGRVTDLAIREQEANGDFLRKGIKKSYIALRDALVKADYIRSDIDFRSLGVADIYDRVLQFKGVGTLGMMTLKYVDMTNEQYEKFQAVSEADFKEFESALKDMPPTYKEVVRVFCALDGQPRSWAARADVLKMSELRAAAAFDRAMDYVCRSVVLPAIFKTKVQDRKIDELAEKLEAINVRLEPLLAEQRILSGELLKFANAPVGGAREAKVYLGSLRIDIMSVNELHVGTRIYNCLVKAGIRYIADILEMPKERWPRIRGIGKKGLAVIEEAMREFGFSDFKIVS